MHTVVQIITKEKTENARGFKYSIIYICIYFSKEILNFNRFYINRNLSRYLVRCHRNMIYCTICKSARVVAYRREKYCRYCTPVMTCRMKKKKKKGGKTKNNSLTLHSAICACFTRRPCIRAVCGKSARVDRDAHLRVARACSDTERVIS